MRDAVVSAARAELVASWRSRLLPVVLVIGALLAVSNAINAAQTVRGDYTQLEHTRAEYAANHMDFQRDLERPVTTTDRGDTSVVTNLARDDYDALSSAIVALSPASSAPQTLGYFAFLFYPPILFLVGLRLSTAARRHGVEKSILARLGTTRTLLSRQLAVLVAAAIVIGATILADVVARSIAHASVAQTLPLITFPPLAPHHDSAPLQWAATLLVVVLFGSAGLTVGAFTGVFAAPAIVFLLWDFVVPILGPGDPRDWLQVLGHELFTYSSGFELAEPIPVATPIAAVSLVMLALVITGLGFVAMRVRNPLAN